MAGGYFNDGAGVNVELGEHVFVTPRVVIRRNVLLAPHAAPAELLPSGGGSAELQVTGQRLRANMGDAERYVVELFEALAESEPGELGYEDNRGHCCRYPDAVCVGAVGTVEAFRFVEMQLEFVSPEVEAPSTTTTTEGGECGCGALPATPATYAGTDTLQDYAAGGVQIGTHPTSLRIEMMRAYPLREIPRARGAREGAPPRGAHLRLIVRGDVVVAPQNLSNRLANLARDIGPGAVNLTGNGNTFGGCVLESLRAGHTDERHTTVEATFIREVS